MARLLVFVQVFIERESRMAEELAARTEAEKRALAEVMHPLAVYLLR
jgi:hypothetical protein